MTRRALLPLLAATTLSACCSVPRNDLIVVLPGPDGHVGALSVEAAGTKMVLDKAFAGAKPGAGGMAPVEVSESEVNPVFGEALAARPVPPKSYTLYFLTGGTDLSPDSQATMDAMLADMAARKAAEVLITGHTDTVARRPPSACWVVRPTSSLMPTASPKAVAPSTSSGSRRARCWSARAC